MVAYLDSSVLLRHILLGDPVHVRTLDALHIATALAVAVDAGGTALFSHDKGMNLCARCLGIPAALA